MVLWILPYTPLSSIPALLWAVPRCADQGQGRDGDVLGRSRGDTLRGSCIPQFCLQVNNRGRPFHLSISTMPCFSAGVAALRPLPRDSKAGICLQLTVLWRSKQAHRRHPRIPSCPELNPLGRTGSGPCPERVTTEPTPRSPTC
jgi:hypothetical protein